MSARYRSLVPIFLLLTLSAASPAMSKTPRDLTGKLASAARWISGQLAAVTAGIAFDRATGSSHREDLERVEVTLRDEIGQGSGDVVKLQKELDATRSQLEILDALFGSTPTREEIERYQHRLAADLAEVLRVQQQHGARIADLEQALEALTRQVEELERDKRRGPGGLPPGPLPEHPVVAVVALGDPAFAGPFELELEQRLRGSNVFVKDERGVLAIRDHLRGGPGVALSELAPVLAGQGFHLLVLAEVEIVGHRELQFLGRTALASRAAVRLEAMSLAEQRSLGSWNGQVEYTALTAESKTRDALRDATYEMGSTIGEYWTAYRSASR